MSPMTPEEALARRQRLWQLGGLLFVSLVVLGVLISVIASKTPKPLIPGKPVPHQASANALFAGIPEQGESVGSPTAPVTLVWFGDPQCTVCQSFSQQGLPGLVSQYVRPGKLRIVYDTMTFIGSDSVRAADVALAAGEQNRFWPFLQLFYDNQRGENSSYVSDNFLRAIADQIGGLNVPQTFAERSGAPVARELAAAAVISKRRKVNSTPSFLIGRTGQALSSFTPGDLSTSSFTGSIDSLLKKP
jgi:protein-disulfide isomerase